MGPGMPLSPYGFPALPRSSVEKATNPEFDRRSEREEDYGRPRGVTPYWRLETFAESAFGVHKPHAYDGDDECRDGKQEGHDEAQADEPVLADASPCRAFLDTVDMDNRERKPVRGE